jgi:hypothetical protein
MRRFLSLKDRQCGYVCPGRNLIVLILVARAVIIRMIVPELDARKEPYGKTQQDAHLSARAAISGG